MKILHKTKYLELRENNGWVYAHRGNAGSIVIIIPVIKNEEILFLKTKRPPLISEGHKGFNIELPAGLVGDIYKDEKIVESAKRELLEETGLVAEKIEILTEKLTSSAGLTDEMSSVLLAKIENEAEKMKPVDDNGVIQERIKVKIKDIPSWLKNEEKIGNTIGAQTLSALFLFLCENK
ncbi:NUDIX hydrolase [bacterium]|nr:NUDIX hydrolase [bacterium]